MIDIHRYPGYPGYPGKPATRKPSSKPWKTDFGSPVPSPISPAELGVPNGPSTSQSRRQGGQQNIFRHLPASNIVGGARAHSYPKLEGTTGKHYLVITFFLFSLITCYNPIVTLDVASAQAHWPTYIYLPHLQQQLKNAQPPSRNHQDLFPDSSDTGFFSGFPAAVGLSWNCWPHPGHSDISLKHPRYPSPSCIRSYTPWFLIVSLPGCCGWWSLENCENGHGTPSKPQSKSLLVRLPSFTPTSILANDISPQKKCLISLDPK